MGRRGLELSFLLLWLVEASRRGLELRSSGFEMPAVMSPWYVPRSYSPCLTSVFSGIRGGGENSVGFGLEDKKVGRLPSKISCWGTILRLWEREMLLEWRCPTITGESPGLEAARVSPPWCFEVSPVTWDMGSKTLVAVWPPRLLLMKQRRALGLQSCPP